MASLNGKVAIVTGGRAGIGLAIVNALLSQGAKVASVDISEPKTQNDDQFDIKCNVAINNEVVTTVKAVKEKFGQVDILVNCAGVMDKFAPIGELSDDVWTKCFSVNVNGPMHFMRAVIPIFLSQESKGNIVNVGSTASIRGAGAGVAYTASKHALLGLSRNTAYMYGKEGIRCSIIFPGGTRGTEITNALGAPETWNHAGMEKALAYQKMLPHYLEPADIAESVLFLATSKAINGAEVAVDKGWTTC